MKAALLVLVATWFPLRATGLRAQAPSGGNPAAPVPNPPGRRCGPAEQPLVLPSAGEVLDTVALLRPLAHPARMLLSLRYENAGRRMVAVVLESDQAPAVTESLRAAIESAARVPPPSNRPKTLWSLRIRLEGGTAPSLGLEQSIFCAAETRSRSPAATVMLSRADTGAVAGASDTVQRVPIGERQEIRLAALLRVSASGAVTDVTLTTRSGQRYADSQFVTSWRRMRFLPALLDGIPVAVTYDTDTERSTPE